MRIATEYLISHGWLLIPAAVIGIVVLALGFFMLEGFEQNACQGFRYFAFIDQRAEAGGYMMQLVNGNMPVIITGVSVGSEGMDTQPFVSLENIQPGNTFAVRTKPIGIEPGRPFNNMAVKITYDVINGEPNKTDTATCFGMVGLGK